MKQLVPLKFNPKTCKNEINELGNLLAKAEQFNERELVKFFQARKQLTAFMASFFPVMMPPDCFSSEFQLFGSFGCDVVVGSRTRQAYFFIEFEDAKPNSVLRKVGKKATTEWALINSQSIICVTFDDVYQERLLRINPAGSIATTILRRRSDFFC